MSETGLDTNENILIGQVTHHWARNQKIPSQYLSTVDSTNTNARADAFSEKSFNENLIVYLTDEQTAGKGRGKNTWISGTRGAQLLSTWSFMIDGPPHPTISPMIGLALYRAAVSTWPFLNFNLKAPNDLYINKKKVAGLLLEVVSQGDDHRLLLGLGINVLAAPESVETASAISTELSKDTPLLAQDWISFLERLVFEISFSLQLSFEPMNSTSTNALLLALNKHPLLSEKYIGLDEAGNLETPTKKISWQEL